MSTAPRQPFFRPDRPIRRDSEHKVTRRFLGTVDYLDAWRMQADLADQRHRGHIGDTYLVLEHPSVYTAGKRTQDSDRPTAGPQCIDVDRGGRITWHGPGQLVVYPIIALADPIDVVDYVRRVEEALIVAVRRVGLAGAGRIDGRSGVWLKADGQSRPDRKIAALGIRVTHGVAMHGLALNCTNTLEYYNYIVPCGIDDAAVTTLSQELGHPVTCEQMAPLVLDALDATLSGSITVADHTLGHAPDPCAGHRRGSR
ncbi:lipoyl(octanoyl) transferase LipB [Corynebacterium mendelii]|uniref:Octanoyltransferase n=1 Tax=Corynebacterium mendelii TaxID=2765362 RepID=A0A939E059_9CORY|nr:lipoyl(octanoyl) transferase LipB [Corynebacterium mendelii]